MDKNTVKAWMIKADHDLEVTRHLEILPSAEETKNAIYLSRTIVNFVQEKIKFKLNL